MTDVEIRELVELLLGGAEPPVMVGQIAALEGAPYGIAVANRSGGVTVRPVSPRLELLLKRYVGIGDAS